MKAWKLLPLVTAIISVNAAAVETTGISLGGGLNFSPAVTLSTENNSNIYSEETNEESSTINRLTPSVAVSGDFGKTTFKAAYQAEQGSYSANSDDDYLDQLTSADASFELNARHQFDIDAAYTKGHDARGSVAGAEAVNAIEPDEYSQTTAGFNYIFGSDSSAANVDFYIDTLQKSYDNNEATTAGREFNQNTAGALLSLKASPASEVLFEVRQSEIDYKSNAVDLDSKIQHLLTGMRWDISGATTGEVKIGRVARTFDSSERSSGTHLNWEASLTWQPLTYSTVVISSAQNTNESNGTGNYIAATTSNISWNHQFSNFITAGISANYGEDEYMKNVRNDLNSGYGINATYSPLTWMDVDLSASQSLRNSNVDGLDKETTLVNLGLTLAL